MEFLAARPLLFRVGTCADPIKRAGQVPPLNVLRGSKLAKCLGHNSGTLARRQVCLTLVKAMVRLEPTSNQSFSMLARSEVQIEASGRF